GRRRLLARLEHELVVHLHDQTRVDAGFGEPSVDPQHRALDDVGRRPLHRGVDGAALGVLAALGVAGIDVRQVEPAAEDGRDEALLAGKLPGLVHVALYAGITL